MTVKVIYPPTEPLYALTLIYQLKTPLLKKPAFLLELIRLLIRIHSCSAHGTGSKTTIPNHSRQLNSNDLSVSSSKMTSMASPFLALPLEIRLQIYVLFLALHPIKNHQLPTRNEACLTDSVASPYLRLLGVGFIPSALLCSCKQIYTKARSLPFKVADLTFANWFGSEIYAAKAFVQALSPWQRDAVRSTSLNVSESDLGYGTGLMDSSNQNGRRGSADWRELVVCVQMVKERTV